SKQRTLLLNGTNQGCTSVCATMPQSLSRVWEDGFKDRDFYPCHPDQIARPSIEHSGSRSVTLKALVENVSVWRHTGAQGGCWLVSDSRDRLRWRLNRGKKGARYCSRDGRSELPQPA
ncbi:hypothetical protein, partial [Acidiphilium sp.]|uniref:hypothetical protein n=1 Tax=Acidiphilium sp. TaxID=527 RepID=UPI002B6F082B